MALTPECHDRLADELLAEKNIFKPISESQLIVEENVKRIERCLEALWKSNISPNANLPEHSISQNQIEEVEGCSSEGVGFKDEETGNIEMVCLDEREI
jgi:hypothetical protein